MDQLSPDQRAYCLARLDYTTDAEVAKALEWPVDRIYRWRYEGVPIDRAVDLMSNDGVVFALFERRRALGKAMRVKVQGLESEDERIRQAAATEIVEWELGKAADTLNVQGEWVELLRGLRDAPGDVEPEETNV